MNNLKKMYLPLRGPNWPCALQGPIFVGREHIPSRLKVILQNNSPLHGYSSGGSPTKKHLSNYFTSSNPHRDIIMS